MSVLRAVNKELKKLAETHPDLATSALAETAKALARELDKPDIGPSAKAAVTKEFRATLADLRAEAPEVKEADQLDALDARRRARRAAASRSSSAA